MSIIANEDKVRAWLEGAPTNVIETTKRLMGEIGRMRETQEIYPDQDAVLSALALTGPTDVRAVILGQDPYHEPGQAMGLAFSVPAGCKLPPSLRNVYAELADDIGCPLPTSGDLTPWAKGGVLLLNTTLTVQAHAAASHAKLGWQTLTGYVVRRCFELPQPIVFLAWGRYAQGLIEDARKQACGQAQQPDLSQIQQLSLFEESPVQVDTKFVIASTHPSPLSARRASGGLPAFMGSRPFSRTNELLRSAGAEPIDWASVCG